MRLTATNIGKKFNKTWIFRDQNFEINSGEMVSITGKNGAGKSTLLQILAGYLTPTKGEILVDGTTVDESKAESVIIGPYTEVIEEFTLKEFLTFHQSFKKPSCSLQEMADLASLPLDKRIIEFSTGMKQRTKLLTAFFFENDLIFMDEPTSNLDEEGFNWWENSLKSIENKLILVASNEKAEIDLCSNRISL